MLTTEILELLESRRIDPELADKHGLTICNGPGGGELVFPYFVGGDIVNRKYRSFDKRFRQDKGAVKCFWNYNALVDPAYTDLPVVITEGEFDALAAIQSGMLRSVSVPDGAPSIQSGDDAERLRKYSYLEHAKAALRDVREIILAVDGDGPGEALLTDLSVRLGKARCKFVQYPWADKSRSRRCKDLNEVLVLYGDAGVRACLDRAQWMRVDGIYRMSELPPYERPKPHVTGFGFLDEHYRVRMGDFAVLTGIPGHGKSTFLNDLCCRLATLHGWRIAMASFEQHPQADHRRALREWFCQRQEWQLQPDQIESADAWIDEHFVFVVPGDDDLANLPWTLDKCAAAVIRHGCRVVTIDPWNELDHDRPPDMSLTEYTGKAIKEFKRLARSLNVHVIVAAHPTKLSGNGGEVPCPGLYDISDSAHWANKPDVGIVVHKPDIGATTAMLRVVKSRYHDEIGRPGTVWAEYDRATRRYAEGADPSAFDEPEPKRRRGRAA